MIDSAAQPQTSSTSLLMDWTNVPDSEHFVQFYEHESFLLESLGDYIGAGLRSSDRCIVVATHSHRKDLDERLHGHGVHVGRAIESGQYVSLDAAEILSQFMVNGEPSQERFRDVIGRVIVGPSEQSRRVRVFGEMVALLWAEGKRTAAMRLEEFWSDLGQQSRFSLFCAYPMSGFQGASNTADFLGICGKHSDIVPTESYAEFSPMSERRRSVAFLQQRAVSLELEIVQRKQSEHEIRRLNEELKRKVDEYAKVVCELDQSRETLNEKLKDLEMFHDLTVDRELKMIALERELGRLTGQPSA